MSGVEYATRESVDKLRDDMRDTERLLRDRDDQKQAELRAEFVEHLKASDERHDSRFDKIDAELRRQTELMLAQKDEELEEAKSTPIRWTDRLWQLGALLLVGVVTALLTYYLG